MGGQCSSTSHLRDEFELVSQFSHLAFGEIQVLKGNTRKYRKQEIGMKQLTFSTHQEQENYLQQLNEAKSYDNIPTLVKVYSFDKQVVSNTKAIAECSTPFRINMYFMYHRKCLAQCLQTKRKALSESKHKPTVNLKLFDYESIDKLPHQERKLVGSMYQEVQILRMIDHVVGALYFLNHFNHNHDAVRPEHILIDQEGKFVLADSAIFQLESIYLKALNEYVHDKKLTPSSLKYLSPELLSHLKLKHAEPLENKEKSDIFNIGLIALEMCLLDTDIHEKILDENNIRLNKTELNKLLIKAKLKYSEELVDLLRCILEYDPQKRITYSALIDMMHPLLTSNIERIQNVYGSPPQNLSMMVSGVRSGKEDESEMKSVELIRRLSEVENKYQRVMNSKVVLQQKQKLNVNLIKEDEANILRELKRVGGVSKPKKKEIKGSDLYELYLHEYESIKQSRPRF